MKFTTTILLSLSDRRTQTRLGHDEISVRILKLCATSISNPPKNFYNDYLHNECFPQTWKKANIIPIHEKGDKQLKKTTDLSHYCLFLVKFLQSYLIHYLNI